MGFWDSILMWRMQRIVSSTVSKLNRQDSRAFKAEIKRFKKMTERDFRSIVRNMQKSERKITGLTAFLREKSIEEWQKSRNKEKWLNNMKKSISRTVLKIKEFETQISRYIGLLSSINQALNPFLKEEYGGRLEAFIGNLLARFDGINKGLVELLSLLGRKVQADSVTEVRSFLVAVKIEINALHEEHRRCLGIVEISKDDYKRAYEALKWGELSA